jgi:hypothetical protein
MADICPMCGHEEGSLQRELLDLITLMPDSQTDEIVDYIRKLKEARRRTKKLNGEINEDWTDEKNK